MKAASHIGWGVHNGKGFRIRTFRPEQAIIFPMRVPARLNLGGIEGFWQFITHMPCAFANVAPAKQRQAA